jgi:hypothetical protein
VLQFQDGHTFSKKRMEEAFASGAFSEPPKKAPKLALDTKQSAESIDIIVRILILPLLYTLPCLKCPFSNVDPDPTGQRTWINATFSRAGTRKA